MRLDYGVDLCKGQLFPHMRHALHLLPGYGPEYDCQDSQLVSGSSCPHESWPDMASCHCYFLHEHEAPTHHMSEDKLPQTGSHEDPPDR